MTMSENITDNFLKDKKFIVYKSSSKIKQYLTMLKESPTIVHCVLSPETMNITESKRQETVSFWQNNLFICQLLFFI